MDDTRCRQFFLESVETSGVVEIEQERIVVRFDKRCHNAILREAALDQPSQTIPWLQNLPLVFQYP
jgi:molecular chaperone GrpE (heat shock protein)